MPRANRHFIPGYAWHITHRCLQSEFFLTSPYDRNRWCYWLFEAKKRYGLSVLDFIVTSNHIHLLVCDTGNEVIPKSMQLIASRVAQEYNVRNKRKGAFWEDRYHATAVETNEHLIECLIYIDLNMVRAGIVSHPSEWSTSGFCEIQKASKGYKIIDMDAWLDLTEIDSLSVFQEQHLNWINSKLESGHTIKDSRWSKSLAVGSLDFVEKVKRELGTKAKARKIIKGESGYCIKETEFCYTADFDPETYWLSTE